MIVSQGLRSSGFVELIGSRLQELKAGLALQVALLSSLVCFLSAFMNNIGALAIIMPVAMQLARKQGRPASSILMPLAFASLLGGMTTLIGTPPNMIISSYRARAGGAPFGLFDFSPVGLSLAILGLLFISLIGWRLMPKRHGDQEEGEGFKAGLYLAELRVREASPLEGKTLHELRQVEELKLTVLSILPHDAKPAKAGLADRMPGIFKRLRRAVLNARKLAEPKGDERLRAGDILVVESDPEHLKELVARNTVELAGDGAKERLKNGSSGDTIIEAVVLPDSPLIKRSVSSLALRDRYGLSLLAHSRQGSRIIKRIDTVTIEAGDLLLLKGGPAELMDERILGIGCLPLGARSLGPRDHRRAFLALGIFLAAALLVMTGLVPVQLAFTLAAAAMVMLKVLPIKDMYKSVDWPIIVLLGAMLSVGAALESSGGAAAISGLLLKSSGVLQPWMLLGLLTGLTMLLSAVINNAATVVLMAPIGISLAQGLGASIDPFLMAIAVGASSSFLTPIAHQSNVLVMGPGGYRFADYLRLGAPLSLLIVGSAIPLILLFWPL
ncbi:MAG TPA: SLC13 family permease [Spirochaetaceae bacterium]|nr:SLC13 family permease [Spirochaetaceae bacterium]